MPVTRSASRASISTSAPVTPPPAPPKRKAVSAPPKTRKTPAKKARTAPSTPASATVGALVPPPPPPAPDTGAPAPADIPAVLSFSFADAQAHLAATDSRFRDIFRQLRCKPFEDLAQVHPFQALAISILGQQISWKAARSITHRFVRMYTPTIPEDVGSGYPPDAFPTPERVARTALATLRSAGLSTRKAEYLQDLAARFADGRLSTEKLIEANDEELAEMLIAVRGIGRWTVDMFAIFSLRRPDILPVGDLGVQRGVLRWFLSLYAPEHPFTLSPEKKKKPVKADEDDTLPVFGGGGGDDADADGGVSSVPPAGAESAPAADAEGLPALPPALAGSVNEILHGGTVHAPLPEGVSVALLKSRLSSKNKVKGAILTPKEMEDLTAGWRPYRSIGVYYMWSLADGDTA